MASELDAGPIYAKKTVSLSVSLAEIIDRINAVINDLMSQLIERLPTPQEQEGDARTFKRRGKEGNCMPSDVRISDFFDRIRMLDALDYPKSYIHYGDLRIEFSDSSFEGSAIRASYKIKKC